MFYHYSLHIFECCFLLGGQIAIKLLCWSGTNSVSAPSLSKAMSRRFKRFWKTSNHSTTSSPSKPRNGWILIVSGTTMDVCCCCPVFCEASVKVWIRCGSMFSSVCGKYLSFWKLPFGTVSSTTTNTWDLGSFFFELVAGNRFAASPCFILFWFFIIYASSHLVANTRWWINYRVSLLSEDCIFGVDSIRLDYLLSSSSLPSKSSRSLSVSESVNRCRCK